MLRPTLLLSALALFAAGAARAADDKPTAPPPPKPGWTVLPDEVPEAKVDRRVIEDDSTRIEELRVRGETRKITVQPKKGSAPAYEIIVGDATHDLSPGANTTRDLVGKRVWRVMDF
ncbi:DUF2782 domain-containing protein [Roseateles violae]|uniref:DUF2782 domain-containing protein n=1 Tax=Roseateles violae TaxID=3058042 RepID=A0ABT8DRL8_9BURK|nr:DUF2782 domain-containing protein [Pelomonas sp. PFR6]MDN3920693.1 DUF2782 domain-containing protein [Pelomonas sp. PFR6]